MGKYVCVCVCLSRRSVFVFSFVFIIILNSANGHGRGHLSGRLTIIIGDCAVGYGWLIAGAWNVIALKGL